MTTSTAPLNQILDMTLTEIVNAALAERDNDASIDAYGARDIVAAKMGKSPASISIYEVKAALADSPTGQRYINDRWTVNAFVRYNRRTGPRRPA